MISNMNKYQISKSPTLERLNLGNSIEGLKNKERGQRIWEIDFLRGFFFFGVILYHFAWDFTFFPTLFSNWYEMSSIYVGLNSLSRICNEILRKDYMLYFVNFFSGGFLFITGVSCSLSHSNLLRSIKISLVALFLVYVFEAIMFPTIFAISLKGVGNKTKRASSFLMMSPVGGAIGPVLMGYVADNSNMSLSFIIPFVSFCVVLFYSWYADVEGN